MPSSPGESVPGSAGPLVSVVMPVFNGAAVVGGAIASVLAQEGVAFEVVVLDDGSRDASVVAVQTAAGVDTRVRLLRNPSNQGLAPTLNRGIRESTGRYVLILHQDCRLLGTDWLDRAVGTLSASSAPGVAGAPVHDVADMSVPERMFWIIRGHAFASRARSGEGGRAPAFSENKCDLFRRSALEAVGGFDADLRHGGEDQVLAATFRARGWRLLFSDDLRYSLSLGNAQTLRSNLRKEWFYGRGERDVVRKVGRQTLGAGSGGPGLDPWKVNRISAVLWPAVSVVGLVLLLLVGRPGSVLFPWLLAVVLVPPILRAIQLGVRAAQNAPQYRLSRWEEAAVALVGPISDLAYVLGWLTP